jgi:hypothetical protein
MDEDTAVICEPVVSGDGVAILWCFVTGTRCVKDCHGLFVASQ